MTNVVFIFFLDLPSPFVRSCFGHAMSKATQYVIDDAKVFVGFLKLSLKGVWQVLILQKIIIWTKHFGKGRQEWNEFCTIVELPIKIFITPLKTNLQQDVISICMGNNKVLHLSSRVPCCQTSVVKTIINIFLPIVQQCVLNQSQGYWLVVDALVYIFSLCNMMKCETSSIEALNYPLIQGNFDSKLQKFKLWMTSQVLKILAHFLAFFGDLHCYQNTHVGDHTWHFVQERENCTRLCGWFYCPSSCWIWKKDGLSSFVVILFSFESMKATMEPTK